MTHDPAKHRRRSVRLPGHDYSQAGTYFVTIACKERTLLLDDPRFGAIVEESWLWLAAQYDYVRLDEYVIMPNHVHGIITIRDTCRGGSRTAPTKRKPLGRLVAAFKTVSTRRINEMRGTPGLPVWQRNYYEHVIRNDKELDRIRQYIVDNPARWEEDPENPGYKPKRPEERVYATSRANESRNRRGGSRTAPTIV